LSEGLVVCDSTSLSVESAPLITIGITCYREGAWLRECWESVAAQTDRRWEAVVVLDGGHDLQTRAVFDELQHPRLRKEVMPANGGPYPTRNRAFELTRTPFHFYVDGDDRLPPDSVATVLKTFLDNPQSDMVYGDYLLFDGRNELQSFPTKVLASDFAKAQPTPGPAAYTRRLWEKLGGFAQELARGNGDYDFLIGAFEAGCVGVHCGGVFYHYRANNPGRVSSSYDRRYHETYEVIVRRHPKFFSDPHIRRRFLANGYRRAALANLAAGDRRVAQDLAVAACMNGDWRDVEMRNLTLERILPGGTFGLLRSLKRRLG
jgi:glycosyltransferase involved in cell wall biosynthesis